MLALFRLIGFLILSLAFTVNTSHGFTFPNPSSRQSVTMRMATSGGLLEKEAPLKTRGPAVLEPETETGSPLKGTDKTRRRERSGNEAWEVRIYNDGLNTREHVARSLVQITGLSEICAYNTMMQAHQNGMAVVGTWVYEIAEMYHDALRKQGILCDLVPVDGDM